MACHATTPFTMISATVSRIWFVLTTKYFANGVTPKHRVAVQSKWTAGRKGMISWLCLSFVSDREKRFTTVRHLRRFPTMWSHMELSTQNLGALQMFRQGPKSSYTIHSVPESNTATKDISDVAMPYTILLNGRWAHIQTTIKCFSARISKQQNLRLSLQHAYSQTELCKFQGNNHANSLSMN